MEHEHGLDEMISQKLSSFLKESELSKEMVAAIISFFDHARCTSGYRWGSLTYRCCQSLNGNPNAAIAGAIALELYALAADIIDDIQDQDNDTMPWRRISLGESLSIATCLIFLSCKALESSTGDQTYRKASIVLSNSGFRASDGQYLEFVLGPREDFVLATYLDIVKKKSGSLIGCACKIGAILANAGVETAERIEEFGWNIGIMAQISNDLRDFLGSGEKGDLFTRKKTLPMLYLLNTVDNPELRTLLAEENNHQATLSLKQMAIDEGAVEYCSVVLEVFRQNARESLENIDLPYEAKGLLMGLVEKTL